MFKYFMELKTFKHIQMMALLTVPNRVDFSFILMLYTATDKGSVLFFRRHALRLLHFMRNKRLIYLDSHDLRWFSRVSNGHLIYQQ